MKDTIGLGIESSCDETAIALLRNGTEILSNIIYSQVEKHAPFQGIVPEIASRAHLEKINYLYEQAIQEAGIRSLEEINFVAVSTNPGLIGSLMIGAGFAKSLYLTARHLTIIPVDHTEAHFYASSLENPLPQYPFLALLLSGGNSTIYKIDDIGKMQVIADTLDDACGEAYDKLAAIMQLGYPGGPIVEKFAENFSKQKDQTNLQENIFPRLLKNLPKNQIAFSFSGIKTAAARAFQKDFPKDRICHDFQVVITELIVRNIKKAINLTGINRVVASGGVLANNYIRQNLTKLAQIEELELHYPKAKKLCTDNAAMVAALGDAFYKKKQFENREALTFTVSNQRTPKYLSPYTPTNH